MTGIGIRYYSVLDLDPKLNISEKSESKPNLIKIDSATLLIFENRFCNPMWSLCRKVDMLVKDIYGSDYSALGRLQLYNKTTRHFI